MYDLRVSISLFWGYPKSLISVAGFSHPKHKTIYHTINELVNQHKVVLDRLFIHLSKIRLRNINEAVAKLKHQRCVCVRPRNPLST